MTTNEFSASAPAPKGPVIRILGIGGAGCNAIGALAPDDAADCFAVDTDARALEAARAARKSHLGASRARGLSAGGDPEIGRAAAEEEYAKLRALCAGADIVFIFAGMGGGTGTGAAPLLARAAKESGALVLAIAAMPFDFEGGRRQRQALLGLQQLRAEADAVICLPNQKLLRMIDAKAGAAECFKLADRLFAEGAGAIRRMLCSPGLVRVDMAALGAATRDARAQSALALAEASGENRAAVLFEKLMASPMLDGRVLEESEAALVSLAGGPDLTMAEVDVFMGLLNQRLPDAQVIFGAAIDPALQGRMSVALIASGARSDLAAPPLPAAAALESRMPTSERSAPELLDPQLPPVRQINQFIPPAPALGNERREQLFNRQGSGRARRKTPKNQKELPFDIISRGRFEKCEPTIRNGEDLDVPTFIRRHVVMN